MEQIAKNIYIETGFPGVVLAAIRLKEGLLMVDSPFQLESQRIWLSNVNDLGSGVKRLLIMLDTHVDRTLGLRAMESLVVGHVNACDIIKKRSTTVRGQDLDVGAECESYAFPLNIRWKVPDMTYSESLYIHWDDDPVILAYHPGAHQAATWLQYDAEKIVFVGDSVMVNQPPFLQRSDLELWINDLENLLSDSFKGYKIISSRNGLVSKKLIDKWMKFLILVKDTIEEVASQSGETSDLIAEVPNLLKKLNFNKNLSRLYSDRLTWGLETYFNQHFLKVNH